MQALKNHNFEGKNKDELLNSALKQLNASLDEVFYDVKEKTTGSLFKTKKFYLTIILKEDLVDYIKFYLKEIIELMGLKTEFEIQKRENYIKVNMISNDSSILIGKNGRTMLALQTLLKQSIFNNLNFKVNIILDANDYKERKNHKIERLAVKLAKDVRKTGFEIKMDSMNSYERRLVHNALTDFNGVTTISEGEEPNRYVVIKPVEK